MSKLLELAQQKQAAELKKAQQAADEKKRAADEENLWGSHPILKKALDRDVCDAYFHGLVFAAIADDDTLDNTERKKLTNIAKALAIGEQDVNEAIHEIMELDGNAKLSLGDEVAVRMKGQGLATLFMSEFSLVWMSHKTFDKQALEEWRGLLAPKIGMKYPSAFLQRFDTVYEAAKDTPVALLQLEKDLSYDGIVYLFADVFDDIDAVLRKEKKKLDDQTKRREARAAQRAQELLHVAMEDAVEKYGKCATVTKEALKYIAGLVNNIEADKLDWPTEVDWMLKKNVAKGSARWGRMYRSRFHETNRANIWRLITLLMLDGWQPKLSEMTDDLDWLLSAKGIDSGNWQNRLYQIIEEYLKDRVVLK